MSIFEKYVAYLKDNPEGYWFKRKLFGWGWVPVRWEGWVVIVVGLAVLLAGAYVGEVDDAPGAFVIGLVLFIAIIFYFGYTRGEKPRWQWGIPKKDLNKEEQL